MFERIMLIVLNDEKCRLHFFVHPEWRIIVQDKDLEYIESLLADFPVRAKSHPKDLFKQLCNLGVGSIVAQEVGSCIDDHPSLVELSSKFIEL
jgi:hypothetical protein